MRQRGRKGALQRECEMLFGRPTTVHHLVPPPDNFAEPEQQIWRTITAKYDLNDVVARMLLENGLRSHEMARRAHEIVTAEGMMITDRRGLPRMHPMVRTERSARELFHRTLKLLRINMGFNDDEEVGFN